MFLVPVQDCALNMLEGQATKLGTFGDDAYYILDGKVWRVSKGVVYRSDDTLESDFLYRFCRESGRGRIAPTVRNCTGCNKEFQVDLSVPAQRRGYCSLECENQTD